MFMCYAADLPGPVFYIMFSLCIHIMFLYAYILYMFPGIHSKCILLCMVCITATKYIKVLRLFQSRAECIELFLFASRYDGWHLSTIRSRCRPGPGTLSELYSIISRCVSRSFPSPAVRESRTLCRSARMHPLMIWNTYHASCIIRETFR